jgi:probable phosphoglycerate mutase
MITKIYLVRHGEAMGNVMEFFQGRTDCDISPKGEKQLEKLAERFADVKYDAIYSSPLLRARKTADAINRTHGLPVHIDERLIEIDGGAWEGMKWTEIAEKFPNEYEIWKNRMKDFSVIGSENMMQVYERMKACVKEIAAENIGRTAVIVSHGCAVRNFLSFAEFSSPYCLGEVGWSDNTAVSLIKYGDDPDCPKIVYKNDSSHLPKELSTLAYSRWNKYEKE